MLYWFVFIILALFSIKECQGKGFSPKVFNVIYILLTLFLIVRKGQGTDYYNYLQIYKESCYLGDISFYSLLLTRDPAFYILNWIAACLGVSYPVLISIFGLVTMVITYRYLRYTCRASILSLLIYYVLFYLIYDFNLIRQGFTLAVEVGVLFPLLVKRKWKFYYIILLLASAIHQSVLICAFFPVCMMKSLSRKVQVCLVLICTIVIFSGVNFFQYLPLPSIIAKRVSFYSGAPSATKIVAGFVRLLLILPVFFISEQVYLKNYKLFVIRNLLLMGYFVYAFTSYNDTLSSRINAYFRIFECYFLYILLFKSNLKIINRQICVIYIAVYSILFVNNISAFIQQGDYKNCTIFSYPYFSVFTNNDEIRFYRKNLGYVDEME